MLRNVVYDLRIFLTFYVIMIVLFSLLIGILGVGNPKIEGSEFKKVHDEAWQAFNESVEEGEPDYELLSYPGIEYEKIGQFVGNLMLTLRMSMEEWHLRKKLRYWITLQ